MTVIQMSVRELTRLRMVIDLADGRLTVQAAATLMSVCRTTIGLIQLAIHLPGKSPCSSLCIPERYRHRPPFRRLAQASRLLVRLRRDDNNISSRGSRLTNPS